MLADEVPPELVTIASRCVRVDFRAASPAAVVDRAPGRRGRRAPSAAAEAAGVAGGDLDRARLLATDERLALRRGRSGATCPAARRHAAPRWPPLVDELRAAIDDAAGPLEARQEAEVAELNERIERYGQRGSGARELEERHTRAAPLRTDELRIGPADGRRRYRDELVGGRRPVARPRSAGDAVQEADDACVQPERRPAARGLLLDLPDLARLVTLRSGGGDRGRSATVIAPRPGSSDGRAAHS